jgi:ubiquinone/menaquinone biosynthesis C-methylase UbiE
MAMNEYAIHGGDEGKKRLEILSTTLAPSTESFLQTAGLGPGMHCLDLGCGGGHVALAMARMVGSHGHVTGLDKDERKIQSAGEEAERTGIKNIRFDTFNAYDLKEEAAYDLVYSRFLLSHLSDPEAVLRSIERALKPRGLLLIEDTDFSGHFSHPKSTYFNRYVFLYQRLLQKRGADANFGQTLVLRLKQTGFTDVLFQISQPAHVEGPGKLMAEITFEGISKALVAEDLVSQEEAARIYAGLVKFRSRRDSLMSLPRIFQVWGRRR